LTGTGVRLNRRAEDIRIGEVVQCLESDDVEVDHLRARSEPGDPEDSEFDEVLQVAFDAFFQALNKSTIADVAALLSGR